MFSGIIRLKARVLKRTMGEGYRLRLGLSEALSGILEGDSIAVNGVCLTAIEPTDKEFLVDISKETLSCTTAADWDVGTELHIETSLCYGDVIGGHLVSGHVDAVIKVLSCHNEGECRVLWFSLPAQLKPLVAIKGSVALDGVSLTVNQVNDTGFCVTLIPHTLQVTNFGTLSKGDKINFEADTLARYVATQLEARINSDAAAAGKKP